MLAAVRGWRKWRAIGREARQTAPWLAWMPNDVRGWAIQRAERALHRPFVSEEEMLEYGVRAVRQAQALRKEAGGP